jgi:hypothetical protein
VEEAVEVGMIEPGSSESQQLQLLTPPNVIYVAVRGMRASQHLKQATLLRDQAMLWRKNKVALSMGVSNPGLLTPSGDVTGCVRIGPLLRSTLLRRADDSPDHIL